VTAPCARTDPELFRPRDGGEKIDALRDRVHWAREEFCVRCTDPGRVSCQQDAAWGKESGIWGGVLYDAGEQVFLGVPKPRRADGAMSGIPGGTVTGMHRHE
jgi:hypothetical protein